MNVESAPVNVHLSEHIEDVAVAGALLARLLRPHRTFLSHIIAAIEDGVVRGLV